MIDTTDTGDETDTTDNCSNGSSSSFSDDVWEQILCYEYSDDTSSEAEIKHSYFFVSLDELLLYLVECGRDFYEWSKKQYPCECG